MTINDVDLIFVADLTFQETIFIGIVDTFVVLGNYGNEFFRGLRRLECPVQDASSLLGYDRLGLRVLNSPLLGRSPSSSIFRQINNSSDSDEKQCYDNSDIKGYVAPFDNALMLLLRDVG